MTDALRNAFRGRQGRYEYNALGESLISGQEDEDAQGSENISVNNAASNPAEGFGVGDALEPEGRSTTSTISDFGRNIRQRFQYATANVPYATATRRSIDGQGTYNPHESLPDEAQHNQTLQQQRQQIWQRQQQEQLRTSEQDTILNCKEIIEGGRVSSTLLQETATHAAQNPDEAGSLADTLGDLSAVCRAQQSDLNALLTADGAVFTQEALLMSALEVSEKLAMVLQQYTVLCSENPTLQLSSDPSQQSEEHLPVPLAVPVSNAAPADQEESEEDMIARAMAESLKSEEERKEREEQESLQELRSATSVDLPIPPAATAAVLAATPSLLPPLQRPPSQSQPNNPFASPQLSSLPPPASLLDLDTLPAPPAPFPGTQPLETSQPLPVRHASPELPISTLPPTEFDTLANRNNNSLIDM